MKAGSEPEIAMPYNTGYEVDAENQQVSYYYRDDAAFVDGTLKDMKVSVDVNGTEYPMTYNDTTKRFEYVKSGLSDGKTHYRYKANGTYVVDAFNSNSEKYNDDLILENCSMQFKPGRITGIHGPSGCGKSILLKLLMRFWDVQEGSVSVDGEDVRKIPTKHLRDMESYVTQETHLFHDSIAANIAIAKPDATRDEIMDAAKKASIHEFIMSLPNGYDNEGIILKSLMESKEN